MAHKNKQTNLEWIQIHTSVWDKWCLGDHQVPLKPQQTLIYALPQTLWSHNSSDSWGLNNKLNLLIKNWWCDAPKKVSITGNCLAPISHHGVDHRQVGEEGEDENCGAVRLRGSSLKGFQLTAKQQLSDFSTSKPKRCFSNQRRWWGTSKWMWGDWPLASMRDPKQWLYC